MTSSDPRISLISFVLFSKWILEAKQQRGTPKNIFFETFKIFSTKTMIFKSFDVNLWKLVFGGDFEVPPPQLATNVSSYFKSFRSNFECTHSLEFTQNPLGSYMYILRRKAKSIQLESWNFGIFKSLFLNFQSERS